MNGSQQKPKILILDDDATTLSDLIRVANLAEFQVHGAMNIAQAKQLAQSIHFSMALVDLHLTQKSVVPEGLDFIKWLAQETPNTLIIAISSDPRMEVFEEARRSGAAAIHRKPLLSADELLVLQAQAQSQRLHQRATRNHTTNPDAFPFAPDGLVLKDNLREVAQRIARSRSLPLVVYGETGTGKEEFAKLVHRRRCETEGPIPFVAVNCANLSGETALSALFGNRKGAFTGATQDNQGYIGAAHGGILFLDEIHTLSRSCQQKLLRVLNDGSYEMLGSVRTLYSEFQLIAASTKDLDDEVDNDAFLLDLRMRISGIDINLPPLRQRMDELPQLIRLFFAKENISIEQQEFQKLVQKCSEFHWQGNIRQLFRALQALVVMSTYNGDSICADRMPIYKSMYAPGRHAVSAPETMESVGDLAKDVIDQVLRPLRVDVPLEIALEEYERHTITHALRRHSTVSDAVLALGVSRSTFAAKRQKFGLVTRPRKTDFEDQLN